MNTATSDDLILKIERLIRAPRERVFDAFTKPEELGKWMAPPGMNIPEASMELRVGGKFRAVMQETNGTQHIVLGTYTEVVRPSRLVHTHCWVMDNGKSNDSTPETIVTIDFIDENGATRIKLSQTGFMSKESRDAHEFGWSSSFDDLQRVLNT